MPLPSLTQSFSEKDIEANLILTMSQSHKEILKSQYGTTLNIFTLSEYVLHGDDVSDPFGGTKSDYIEIYNELNSLIEKLKNKILE